MVEHKKGESGRKVGWRGRQGPITKDLEGCGRELESFKLDGTWSYLYFKKITLVAEWIVGS